jgi:hypothetical protein
MRSKSLHPCRVGAHPVEAGLSRVCLKSLSVLRSAVDDDTQLMMGTTSDPTTGLYVVAGTRTVVLVRYHQVVIEDTSRTMHMVRLLPTKRAQR